MPLAPGMIRDPIVEFLVVVGSSDASAQEIMAAVQARLGAVPPSSVRSYLNLNTPTTFERTARGRYRLSAAQADATMPAEARTTTIGKACLHNADCFDWLARQPPASVHAIVSDPPYGVVEYTEKETAKLRAGKGGVWRVPPSFDGHQRAPLPRFTVLTDDDRRKLFVFFKRLGFQVARVAVPGANVVIASNPLLAHIVGFARAEAGLELRGYVARQVMTMRGGAAPRTPTRSSKAYR